MTYRTTETWQRISTYPFLDTGGGPSLQELIAVRFNAPDSRAGYLLHEYKKLVYLRAIDNSLRIVAPKILYDIFDLQIHELQHEFWGEFCGKVIKGPMEFSSINRKRKTIDEYSEHYEYTKDKFATVFDQIPDHNIWPDLETSIEQWIEDMSYEAKLIAIGPFSQAVLPYLEYPPTYYRNVSDGDKVIVTVSTCDCSSDSSQLANSLGFGLLDLGQHCVDNRNIDYDFLVSHEYIRDKQDLKILVDNDFELYFLPNG